MSPEAVLLTVFGVHLAASVSPGPNVLLIVHTAATASRRTALAAAAGVASGAAVLSAAAALGLGLLVAETVWLDRALRLVCGLYLVHLGVRMWRGADVEMRRALERSAQLGWLAYRRGLLTNITNPKSAVFFGSVLTGLLAPGTPLWVRLATVAICMLTSAVWHTLLALAFSTDTAHRLYGRAKPVLDRIVGALMALLGVRFLQQVFTG